MSEDEAPKPREGHTLAKRELVQSERVELLALTTMPGWNVLLDLMEMECIKTETDLINVPEEDETKVLALHKTSKAAWRFFVRIQKQVNTEIEIGMVASELTKPRRPLPETPVEEILDPTRATPE